MDWGEGGFEFSSILSYLSNLFPTWHSETLWERGFTFWGYPIPLHLGGRKILASTSHKIILILLIDEVTIKSISLHAWTINKTFSKAYNKVASHHMFHFHILNRRTPIKGRCDSLKFATLAWFIYKGIELRQIFVSLYLCNLMA